MLADAHRQKAEEIESDSFSPQKNRSLSLLIEGAWGAAFQWICFGCQVKYHRHQESHAHLMSYLSKLGEGTVAAWWQSLENLRQGGWYGGKTQAPAVQEAFDFLAKIRTWANIFDLLTKRTFSCSIERMYEIERFSISRHAREGGMAGERSAGLTPCPARGWMGEACGGTPQ